MYDLVYTNYRLGQRAPINPRAWTEDPSLPTGAYCAAIKSKIFLPDYNDISLPLLDENFADENKKRLVSVYVGLDPVHPLTAVPNSYRWEWDPEIDKWGRTGAFECGILMDAVQFNDPNQRGWYPFVNTLVRKGTRVVDWPGRQVEVPMLDSFEPGHFGKLQPSPPDNTIDLALIMDYSMKDRELRFPTAFLSTFVVHFYVNNIYRMSIEVPTDGTEFPNPNFYRAKMVVDICHGHWNNYDSVSFAVPIKAQSEFGYITNYETSRDYKNNVIWKPMDAEWMVQYKSGNPDLPINRHFSVASDEKSYGLPNWDVQPSPYITAPPDEYVAWIYANPSLARLLLKGYRRFEQLIPPKLYGTRTYEVTFPYGEDKPGSEIQVVLPARP